MDVLRFVLGLCIVIVFSEFAYGQSVPQIESVRSDALAGATVALGQTQPFDLNPAGFALDSAHSSKFNASFTPFVAGLDKSVEFAGNGGHYFEGIGTSLGLGFERYGYSTIFSDQTATLIAAKYFDLPGSHHASSGLRVRYETLSFGTEYPSISSLLVDAGLQLALTPALTFGAAATNLLGSHFDLANGDRENLTRAFHAGFAYAPKSGSITLLAAVEDEIGQKAIGHFAAEYLIENIIALRIGATSDPSTITGGVGIKYAGLQLDAAAVYSPLGTTLSFGVGWLW